MIFTLTMAQNSQLLSFTNQSGAQVRATSHKATIREQAMRLVLDQGQPIVVRGDGRILAYVTPKGDADPRSVVWNFTLPLDKSRKPLGFGDLKEKAGV